MLTSSGTCLRTFIKSICTQIPSPLTAPGTSHHARSLERFLGPFSVRLRLAYESAATFGIQLFSHHSHHPSKESLSLELGFTSLWDFFSWINSQFYRSCSRTVHLSVSKSGRKPERERNEERRSTCWICFPSSGNICGTDWMQQGRMWAWDFSSPKDCRLSKHCQN